MLRTLGQRLPGEPPADLRVLTVRIPPGPPPVPGDLVSGIVLTRGPDDEHHVLLDGGDRAHVPLAGLQCDGSLVARYGGARPFEPALVRIGPGGEIEMPPAEAVARKVTIGLGVTMGYGAKGPLSADLDRSFQRDGLFTVGASFDLRYRLFARSWFVLGRVGIDALFDGLYVAGAEDADGRVAYIGRDETAMLLSLSLLGGWAGWVSDGVIEVYGGPGFGPMFVTDSDLQGEIRSLLLTVGVRRPLSNALAGWSLVLEFRGALNFHIPHLVQLTDDVEDGQMTGTNPADVIVDGLEVGRGQTTGAVTTLLGVYRLF